MAFRSGAVATADSLNVSEEIDFSDMAALEEFKALSITVPIESTKYSFLSMFIERAFQLSDPQAILKPVAGLKPTAPVEVLPHIAVPSDIWLHSYISIPNARAKISILKEVNELLKLHISDLQHENFLMIDEHILADIEQRVADSQYTLLTMPEDEDASASVISSSAPPQRALSTSTASSVFSGESDASLAQFRPPSIPGSAPGRRRSSFSRDFMANTRKLSFLGHSPKIPPSTASPDVEEEKSTLPPLASPLSSPSMQKQAPNGLWSSRIYKKIRKKRGSGLSELSVAASQNSGQSGPTIRQRADFTDDKSAFPHKNSHKTMQQQLEIQKDKFEYFTNSRLLGQNIRALVEFIGKTGSRAALSRLLEFIKESVFKFIVVDVCHMVLENGEYRGINGWV